MEARLEEGFLEQATRLGIAVAPVGPAWAEAHRSRPELELWDGDGRHPSRAGSYLAACVFAVTLGRSDRGPSDFTGELRPEDARYLQALAASVVRG
ncbi:MAG TPA: hypothetical protein VHK22_08510 [Gaiellaceae bacterium]|nr:hypothetical protein [Gaiellaceae bacterium]